MASLMAQKSAAGAFTKRMPARSAVAARPAVSRSRAVSVRASAPLVCSQAPDFKAQAVYDQEFVEVRPMGPAGPATAGQGARGV